MSDSNKSTSDLLVDVVNYKSKDKDSITLLEIKLALHERGFAVLILLFAIPLSIPLPVPPGYTTILAIPLILFSYQLLMNFDSPWLPKWLAKKSIKRTTLAFIVEKTNPLLKRIERFMKPRLLFIFNNASEKFIAILSLICAILIAIPIPFIHFIPAWGIAVISLGLLSKDGLMIIIGTLISFIGILIASIIFIFGPKIIIEMFSFLLKST